MIRRYIVRTDPRTKKNSMDVYVNPKTGKPIVRQSKAYREYEDECGWQLLPRPRKPIACPVIVKEVFYMGTRRKVDLNNLIAAMDDILVKFRILEDDNCRIVIGHDGSRVRYDKQNPRIEITITEVGNGRQENF